MPETTYWLAGPMELVFDSSTLSAAKNWVKDAEEGLHGEDAAAEEMLGGGGRPQPGQRKKRAGLGVSKQPPEKVSEVYTVAPAVALLATTGEALASAGRPPGSLAEDADRQETQAPRGGDCACP